MITVGMNYHVLPDKGSAFEAMFNKVLEVMGSMSGHAHSSLYKDVNNANSYLIISKWDDRSAFDSFIGSQQFRQVADWGKEQILAGRPSHDYYE
ncbi:MAG: antibiotic biosynthesis monooxygenase [Phycisphaeraceae bacterium]|nr:antibiotic biosynthesis monooxygenase [Phycisphaeraceae bacterium]|tara:strand:- start:768 stop:1049 length:282 start_codon:yes stop_codon:yes gene_type:complete